MIAAVAHDAGGAEIVSSYVRRSGLACRYALEGPAVRVFERKLGTIELSTLEEAIASSASLICGTSWQSDLELRAIALARELGKPSVAFLDHWVNYRERFLRDGELCLPDEIWVGDALAEDTARGLFGSLSIRRVENPYFADILDELRESPAPPAAAAGTVSVLYVTEPIREHAVRQFGDERHWGYVEEDALRYFLSHVTVLGTRIGRIVIRAHPAEAPDKYRWAAREFDLAIETGGQRPLTEDIAASDVVVGCQSMAMVIGLLAGKRVISAIPPGGHPCRLPQPQIEHLQTLASRMHQDKPQP